MQEKEKKENKEKKIEEEKEDKTRQEKKIQHKFLSTEKIRIKREYIQEKEKKKNEKKKIQDGLNKAKEKERSKEKEKKGKKLNIVCDQDMEVILQDSASTSKKKIVEQGKLVIAKSIVFDCSHQPTSCSGT